MQFQPKTKQQLQQEREERSQLLDIKAVYDFDVHKAEEGVSKKGNEMLILTLNVHTSVGVKQFTDYITTSQEDKLFAFCESCGLMGAYQSGQFEPDDCAGASGKLKLGIEKGGPSPGGGFYPDKNKVGFYVTEQKKAVPKVAAAGRTAPVKDEDDDVPF